MTYVYQQSEPGLYTVFAPLPNGNNVTDSDHDTKEAAAERAAYLNGAGRYQTNENHSKLAEAIMACIDAGEYGHGATDELATRLNYRSSTHQPSTCYACRAHSKARAVLATLASTASPDAAQGTHGPHTKSRVIETDSQLPDYGGQLAEALSDLINASRWAIRTPEADRAKCAAERILSAWQAHVRGQGT